MTTMNLMEWSILKKVHYNTAIKHFKQGLIKNSYKDEFGRIKINVDSTNSNQKTIPELLTIIENATRELKQLLSHQEFDYSNYEVSKDSPVHTWAVAKEDPVEVQEPEVQEFWEDDCTKTAREQELYEDKVKAEYKKRNMNYKEAVRFFEVNHKYGSHIRYLNVSDTQTKEECLADIHKEDEEMDKDVDLSVIKFDHTQMWKNSNDNEIKILEDNGMSLFQLQDYLESIEKEDQYISSKLIELYTEMLGNDKYNQDNLKELITFSKILEWAERDISVEEFIEEKRISRELTHV